MASICIKSHRLLAINTNHLKCRFIAGNKTPLPLPGDKGAVYVEHKFAVIGGGASNLRCLKF